MLSLRKETGGTESMNIVILRKRSFFPELSLNGNESLFLEGCPV